jgi:hypothetical protein
MKKEERIKAIMELAKKHPYDKHVGYLWKNPFNPKSLGIRWTTTDLELFRLFQFKYQQKQINKHYK